MDATIGSILASVWVQGGLVALALGSIGYDKADTLKAVPAKLTAWWTSRRAGKTSPTADNSCESRRLTLVGVRHKASELKDATARADALAKCDEMDALVAILWPEAA